MAKTNKNSEGRRLYYDEHDRKIYDNLKSSSNPFKKLNTVDLFAIALVYGKKFGIRMNLDDDAIGRVRKSTIDGSNLRYLMMAIASDEEKSIDVLANEDDYFTICEEYAKTGVDLINSEVLDKHDKILDDMELEIIEFYDKYIEKVD